MSHYLSECPFPPRRGSSRWGSIFCNVSQEVVSSFPDLSSLATDFPGSWYPYEVLPGFDEAEEGVLAVKFIMGRDLAATRPSPDSCWARFAIAAVQVAELKLLMLNKFNKWFHSSRVKFPLVKMSASWFLVSMYLIWILGSKLIRSNNQSRVILWVLETCLIVGLLSLMIILITASLSLNTYNKVSWCEVWTFEGTESMSFIASILLWDLWCLWSSLSGFPGPSGTREMFQEQKQLDLRPISVQCPERWFRFCWTVRNSSLFLAHPSYWNKSMTSQMHNVPPEVDFESSRSPAKSESWNSPSLHCLAVLPTLQYCLDSHWFRRLSKALVNFVMDRASLFTDHRMSALPIRAKLKKICNNLRACIWQFSNRFHFFFFEVVIIDAWRIDALQSCCVVLFANSQCRSTHFFASPSIS